MDRVCLTVAISVLVAGCHSLGEHHADRDPSTLAAPVAAQPHVSDGLNDITVEGKSSVQLAIARLHEQNGQAARAMNVYREVLKRSPDCAEAMWRLAVLHDLQDAFDKSEPFYVAALEIAPELADLRCNFGYSLYFQNRWDEAESQLRESLRLNPDHRRARTNLGLVLARSGRSDEAFDEFRKAGCTPSQAHANVAYADCLRGALPRALEHYETALQLDPQSDTAKAGQREVVHMLTEASVASVDQ